MISSLLIEAALRSVFLALAVGIGLRVFSVRNVLAQKVAWGLVLASALAMPVVLPMTEHWSVLPANVRVVIPADPENLLEELQARIQAKSLPELKASTPAPAEGSMSAEEASLPDQAAVNQAAANQAAANQAAVKEKMTAQPSARLQANADDDDDAQSSEDVYQTTTTAQPDLSGREMPQPAPVPAWRRVSILQLGGLVYLSVAGVLCARLLYGLFMALRVWRTAKPILLDQSSLTEGLHLRVSNSISSPVTIGSAVVLPREYCEWDSEKLRIVLAHERSHIRQGDFYLQLLAGVYAALVWFSPLGWWLKRTLSDLAEAIRDRAGLEEAADRTAYAQILLEFAASPRPTLIGVAMARHGSLSRRIERLLNDVSFRQAFAGSRRALVAVVVIPLALFAATAMVHVEAAGQQSPAAPSAPAEPQPPQAMAAPDVLATPAIPEAGSSFPDSMADVPAPAIPESPANGVIPKAAESYPPAEVLIPVPAQAPGTPTAAPSPASAPAAPVVAPVPGVAPVPAANAPSVMILQGQPGMATLTLSRKVSMRSPVVVVPHIATIPSHATLAIIAPPHASVGEGHSYGIGQSNSNESGTVIASNNGRKSGYHYWSSNGDSYAVVRGNDKEHLTFSGNWIEGRHEEIEKARTQAAGKDFLWFTHDGKAYFVDDPAALAQIEAMYKPMEDLGHQQEELGKKQEALGKQQEDLGRQQEAASVPTPDMSKEIAKIEEAMAKLKASQGKNMTQDQFADLQEKLGELQSRIGEIQGQIGEKQGEFGSRMGELGDKMGALGSQMGELGAQQGKLAQEADRKVKSIIDESLKNGKAHPVQ